MTATAFLVLRRMRAPLIAVIVIYAVSIAGLTLIPGVDADGRPAAPLSFFDAFYFVSYTATTIGFGEIPSAFSYGQRMWVVVCIYLSVVGWTYSIVTLLNLLREEAFQQARATQTFARRVRRMADPFFLVVGYGETGWLLCRALDHLRIPFVLLDESAERIDETKLQAAVPSRDRPGSCPRCRIPLKPFRDPVLPADARIDRCRVCEGIWLNRGELARLKGRHARSKRPPDEALERLAAAYGSEARWTTVSELDRALDPVLEPAPGLAEAGAAARSVALWVILRVLLRLLLRV